MAPEFHQRVRKIFEQALERPEPDRLAFAKNASAGDVALSDAVERLIRARNVSESFLETAPLHTDQIGRYLIHGELGRGAMGVVYDAVDPMIGRRVAVKVINLKAGTDSSESEFMKERLFREARSAGRLFHPGIVVILDVGLHGDSAFITMERVEGQSLQQLLASGGLLDSKVALGILQQTAAALDYAHQHGVVHRDIKPANIMLQSKVTVKVADFGIAKLMSAQNPTVTGMLMGTPSYMSPEQIEARAVDGRSDQFSLAVLAYELLTGSRPFQADSMPTVAHLIVYGTRPSAHAANPLLPPGIDQVLDRALNRFPEQRFPDCAEFAAALEAAFLGNAVDHKVSAHVPEGVNKRWPTPLLYVGGIAFALLALALASVSYRNLHANAGPPAYRTATSQSPTVLPAAPPVKPTPLGSPQRDVPSTKPVASRAEKIAPIDKYDGSITAPPLEVKPDPKAKPVPASFRAEEFYHAALAKRGEGKPEDAAALLREAADLGDANAMEELGESYRTGEGLSKDGLEATRWFLRAATAGNSSAMVSLGALYLLGDGVPQSDDEAVRWFQRAADLKNSAGLYDLARLYENGAGVSRNLDKAKQLYQESATLGNAEAQRRLTELQSRK
jgi:serine/threonine protein kinase